MSDYDAPDPRRSVRVGENPPFLTQKVFVVAKTSQDDPLPFGTITADFMRENNFVFRSVDTMPVKGSVAPVYPKTAEIVTVVPEPRYYPYGLTEPNIPGLNS